MGGHFIYLIPIIILIIKVSFVIVIAIAICYSVHIVRNIYTDSEATAKLIKFDFYRRDVYMCKMQL